MLEAVAAPAAAAQQLALHIARVHTDALSEHDVDVLEGNVAQVLPLQLLQKLETGAQISVLKLEAREVEVERKWSSHDEVPAAVDGPLKF